MPLHRLTELFSRGSSSDTSGIPLCDGPLHLLGVPYNIDIAVPASRDQEATAAVEKGSEPGNDKDDAEDGTALAAFYRDFTSRLRFTYRRDFEVIAGTELTSDVGWGCMLRSGQMLLGQALLTHQLGRTWRRNVDVQALLPIIRLFLDAPGLAHPYSIHNLVHYGAPHGVRAGAWLGPYALCKAMEAASLAAAPDSLAQSVLVHVVAGEAEDGRGGAPALCIDKILQSCTGSGGSWRAVLLVIPVLLGTGATVNPHYVPLLRQALSFPQSTGAVGGKPERSHYFVGTRGDHVLFLDPHEVQVATKADALENDTPLYFCSDVRHMPLAEIDPSVALGFYIRDPADFESFCASAKELVATSQGAPVFTVQDTSTHKDFAQATDWADESWDQSDAKDRDGHDDWTII
eukprot:jgi/Chlat1/8368/Chrsp80S07798